MLLITHGVLLFSSELARRLEVHSKVCEFTFVILTDVLDGVDMERYNITVNRENNRLCFSVNEDLWIHLVSRWIPASQRR